MPPVAQCLIHWKLHPAHDWWYTDEGGGHMVIRPDRDSDTPWHCLGIAHIAEHRGMPRGKWDLRDYPKGGAHAGPYQPEVDVDYGFPIV